MEERSGLSDAGRFVAAILYYCDMQLVRLDIYGLSNALRSVVSCQRLEPFVQLETQYAILTGRSERWYSLKLKEAIDELVIRGAVKRIDYCWLYIEKGILKDIVDELMRVVPDISRHVLGIVSASMAIKASSPKK